jgi:hypothetical protein
MSDQEHDGEFKVKDKRKFTSEGLPREGKEEPKGEPSLEPQPSQDEPTPSVSEDQPESFQMTFETLVMSLSSTAMVQLGLIADPSTNQPAQNLPAAKHTIDILEILQQKTKGNLTASEQKMLDNILYELRMTYLEIGQSIRIPR